MMKMSARESRPNARRARQADRRPALLAVLRAADAPLSVDEVATAIGTAVPTARFHLSMLVSAGSVQRVAERSGGAGRPSWRYALASPPVASNPYRDLARALAVGLEAGPNPAAAARDAGRRWSEAAAAEATAGTGADHASAEDPVGALAASLDRLGFAAEPRVEDGEVLLHACPFVDVAREHRAVVCGLHLGLAEGAATAIGGVTVTGLEPFRTEAPLVCALRVDGPRRA